jgi:hypothetical protein
VIAAIDTLNPITVLPTAAASAVTSPAPLVVPFGAEEIESLVAERKGRRVFRHVLVGQMPSIRERDTWMLSRDGRELTISCEHDDPPLEEVAEHNPEPPRWFLVGSATFVATDLVPGQSVASHYRRERLRVIPKPIDRGVCDHEGYDSRDCNQLGWTACGDIGEELAISCAPSKLPLLGPNALVQAERSGDGHVIRWQPSARRAVSGLSCVVAAPKGRCRRL